MSPALILFLYQLLRLRSCMSQSFLLLSSNHIFQPFPRLSTSNFFSCYKIFTIRTFYKHVLFKIGFPSFLYLGLLFFFLVPLSSASSQSHTYCLKLLPSVFTLFFTLIKGLPPLFFHIHLSHFLDVTPCTMSIISFFSFQFL